MSSPYDSLPVGQWQAKTEELLLAHPLKRDEIVEVTLTCWDAIFATKIGGRALIGVDIFPRPQIMGEFLHELIPLEFSSRYPDMWRREKAPSEKDLVYIPDSKMSVEIKTSSSKSQIYGNRSYAQQGKIIKKAKSGYYLGVNFEKFKPKHRPSVSRIHFGWIDESDWVGQKSQTGQQSRLQRSIYGKKLLLIHSTD